MIPIKIFNSKSVELAPSELSLTAVDPFEIPDVSELSLVDEVELELIEDEAEFSAVDEDDEALNVNMGVMVPGGHCWG